MADVADLTEVHQSGLLTLWQVDGSVSLVLSRWDVGAQDWFVRPAQTVLVDYASTGNPQTIQDESGLSVAVDGWFDAMAPFDVEGADRFALGAVGDEEPGEILRVLPVWLGRQRAAFRLFLGEVS